MANLTDSFSDAAVQDDQTDGRESVATAFNAQSTTVKEPMTTEAVLETPVLETSRIIVPREELSDEAFAAVKNGDVLKLKSLLMPNSGLDLQSADADGASLGQRLLDRAVDRFALLKNAVEQSETDKAQDELLRQVDPDSRADAGLAALMLSAANGNVDVAQMVLDEMEDDELEADDDDEAAEIALEHGNFAVYNAIIMRHQRNDFNKAASDPHEAEREPEQKAVTFDGNFEWFLERTHKVSETIREDFHKVANAVRGAAHATSVATHEAVEAVAQFFSTFLHIGTGATGAKPDATTAQAEEQAVQVVQAVTQVLDAVTKPQGPAPGGKP